MRTTTTLIVAALTALALTGCAQGAVVDTAASRSADASGRSTDAPGRSTATPTAPLPPSAPVSPSAPVPPSASTASGVPTTPDAAGSDVFPAGQPPRPGRQDAHPSSDTVPGLTAAVRAADHPGLQICGDDLASLVTASGDLRGDGGTQYLIDTTCAMATGSSPDEVALYDVHGGAPTRSAVLSEYTANRPEPSAYPYLWQGHTVVLAYDQGTTYRLVRLLPDRVVQGLVQAFH